MMTRPSELPRIGRAGPLAELGGWRSNRGSTGLRSIRGWGAGEAPLGIPRVYESACKVLPDHVGRDSLAPTPTVRPRLYLRPASYAA